MSTTSSVFGNPIDNIERAAIAEEQAVIAANKHLTEKLRKKRAELDEQRFIAERNREAWQ